MHKELILFFGHFQTNLLEIDLVLYRNLPYVQNCKAMLLGPFCGAEFWGFSLLKI